MQSQNTRCPNGTTEFYPSLNWKNTSPLITTQQCFGPVLSTSTAGDKVKYSCPKLERNSNGTLNDPEKGIFGCYYNKIDPSTPSTIFNPPSPTIRCPSNLTLVTPNSPWIHKVDGNLCVGPVRGYGKGRVQNYFDLSPPNTQPTEASCPKVDNRDGYLIKIPFGSDRIFVSYCLYKPLNNDV